MAPPPKLWRLRLPVGWMKTRFPLYGCFPRWPDAGLGWVHPDDAALATQIIPSGRVLRRESFDGSYYHHRYGEYRLRTRPVMWMPIVGEGVDIGDEVEVIGRIFERDLYVGHVAAMVFVPRKGRVVYRLARSGVLGSRWYVREHFRVLTNKDRLLRGGETVHPLPRWNGAGRRIELE